MKNHLRNTKTFILFILLLLSIFSVMMPALPAYESPVTLESTIYVSWSENELEPPIIPRDEVRKVNVTVEYRLNPGLSFSEGMYINYLNYEKFDFTKNKKYAPEGATAKAFIDLKIIEIPTWCKAVFETPSVGVNISSKHITNTTLYMIIDEDAPSYSQGYIKIKATMRGIATAPIRDFENEFNLSFQPEYYPYINVDLPDVNTIKMNPDEIKSFPINVENLGNEETKVFLKVESLPEGWSTSVTDAILVDVNKTATAQLSVKPSKTFGYQDEKGIIRVSLTPARALNISNKGEPITISFLVHSIGYSGQGFIGILPFIILLIIIIVIIYIVVKKRLAKII